MAEERKTIFEHAMKGVKFPKSIFVFPKEVADRTRKFFDTKR